MLEVYLLSHTQRHSQLNNGSCWGIKRRISLRTVTLALVYNRNNSVMVEFPSEENNNNALRTPAFRSFTAEHKIKWPCTPVIQISMAFFSWLPFRLGEGLRWMHFFVKSTKVNKKTPQTHDPHISNNNNKKWPIRSALVSHILFILSHTIATPNENRDAGCAYIEVRSLTILLVWIMLICSRCVITKQAYTHKLKPQIIRGKG